MLFEGPPIFPEEYLEELCPPPLAAVLRKRNGWLTADGLHVRGVCLEPRWHSLDFAWRKEAFHRRYTLRRMDVPFAQNCVGDQFVLREQRVHRLWAETGHLDDLACDLPTFLGNPGAHLETRYLELLGRPLEPGQLLSVYPFRCSAQAEAGVSVRAIPALEVIAFNADLYRQIGDLPRGTRIQVKITE